MSWGATVGNAISKGSFGDCTLSHGASSNRACWLEFDMDGALDTLSSREIGPHAVSAPPVKKARKTITLGAADSNQ